MLITKDENIKTSSVYIASLILKYFNKKKTKQLTIQEISFMLGKEDIIGYRQLVTGLSFLFVTGIIDFKEPYVYITNDKN